MKLTTPDEQRLLRAQILRGGEYMAHLQDKAGSLGLGDVAVAHEDRQKDVVTGNVAKAAASFARAARSLGQRHANKKAEYLSRAKRAFAWIKKHGPIIDDDYSSFSGVRFSEKANIHCGAWSKDGRIYNKGLLYFGSWYHGHNNIYAFAASLALEFDRLFQGDNT